VAHRPAAACHLPGKAAALRHQLLELARHHCLWCVLLADRVTRLRPVCGRHTALSVRPPCSCCRLLLCGLRGLLCPARAGVRHSERDMMPATDAVTNRPSTACQRHAPRLQAAQRC
jgi:hypothetical protein